MSKSRLFSGKIKKLSGGNLTVDRYEYLDSSQAEPDLGLPSLEGSLLTGSTSTSIRTWSNILTASTNSVRILSTLSTFGFDAPNALVVAGGVSIGGYLNVSGKAYLNNAEVLTTQSGLTSILGISVINQTLFINTTTNSTSTNSGALIVLGGVGIGKDLYVGGDLTLRGALVITTASIGASAVTSITAGTDTAISTSTGPVTIWNTSTLQSVTGRGNSTTNTILITNITSATSTDSGALKVVGGVGIGKDLYVGGKIYSNTAEVITTASVNQYANQTTITAGTDTAINTSTGNITIWNTSTLQTVTDRGNSTTNVILVLNTTNSISTDSGALQIIGGVGIGEDLYVGGAITVTNIGVTELITATNISISGISTITNTTEAHSTVSGALQVAGGVGIGGSLVVGGNLFQNDQQIVATFITAGTDTAISSSTGAITIWNTSTLQTVTDRGNSSTNAILITNITSATSTNSGALQVVGGAGIGGNLYVGGEIVAQKLTIEYTTITTTIVETDDIIKTANTTNASNTYSGALQVAGGASIGQDLWVGRNLYLNPNGVQPGGIQISSSTTILYNDSYLELSNPDGIKIGINSSTTWTFNNLGITFPDATTQTTAFIGYANTATFATSSTYASSSTYADVAGIALSLDTGTYTIVNTTNSTSTDSGALTVVGGVGIGGNLNVSGSIYSNNQQIVATTITAGTDTAINTSTGAITIWNTSTLQTVSDRGNSTTNAILITNATSSTSTDTGALQVTGGVGIGGDLSVGHLLTFNPVIWNYVPTTFTSIPVTYGETHLTFTVQIDGTITDMSVAQGAGGYGPGSVNLTIPGNTFPGGTTPANDIVFNVQTFPVPDFPSTTDITSAVSYVSGTIPPRYDNIYSSGTIGIGAGNQHWAFSTDGTLTNPGKIAVFSTANSLSTTTGALTVIGGAGIGKELYVGGKIYSNTAEVLTTASVNQYANQTTITAGTDTAISTSTGNLTIWNTSTLQTVSDRGNSTTNAILITNITSATSTTTGALQVVGGIGVGNDVWVGGRVVTSAITATTNLVIGTTGAVEIRNNGHLTNFSSNGNIEIGGNIIGGPYGANQLDLGASASLSAVRSIGGPNGGVLIRTGTDTSITNTWQFSYDGDLIAPGKIVVQSTTNSTSTNTGALTVTGGVGIGGNLYVGGSIFSGDQRVVATTITAGTDTAISSSTGAITIWNTSTLQSITNRGNSTTNTILVINTTNSTSTTTGALTVSGGVGIQGNVYIGGSLTLDGALVITTASIANSAVTSITAGTDTAVSASTGAITIWNTSTLQSITNRGNSTTNTILITNITSATSTSSGALQVTGGAGIGGDLYIGGVLYQNGVPFLSTSTIDQYVTPTVITAGTDTAVSTSTGNITIWNSSTLQSVSSRGNSTTNAIVITNTTSSTSTNTGALTVAGGVGIGGNLFVGGDVNIKGSLVITTSSITAYVTPTVITAGTDTAVSTSTGNITIWNTSTLQSVTNRGSTTTNAVYISNTSSSTTTDTGALVVTGGVGIGGNVNIGGGLVASGINLLNQNQHIWYVDPVIGVDDYTKNGHPLSPARTIKYILGYADDGDTVFIQPGTYYEEFPLTINKGVSVRGAGLREVLVYPTTATNNSSAFLLNGDALISDFTVGGFFKPGYAFEFAPNAVITSKSPYIERFSVITKGSVTSTNDPYGFNSNDAGNGAKIDGSRVLATSTQAAMMFNEATFIVPNATGIYMTNGARAEIINGFFYFADKAINAVTSSTGYAGAGKTKLKLGNVTTGTFTAGDTIIYKSSTGTTLASGTIASVDGSYVYINGPAWGFVTSIDRTAKIVSTTGTAVISTAQHQFGSSSLYINGSGGNAIASYDTDFFFNTGDWTIEFWTYRTGGNSSQILVDLRTAVTSETAPVIYLVKSGSNYLLTYFTAGVDRIAATSNLGNNTWHNIAVSKRGGFTRLYLDGTQVGSTYTDNNSYVQGAVKIGSRYDLGLPYTGYIDELRISRVGRYANSTFTVPTTTLINDADTVLLLHFEGTNGSTIVTDDNVTLQDITSTGAHPAAASNIVLADYHQFGAEIRSLGSAAIFGNSGVTANGTGTDIKLIAFNMSHIGAGKDSTDDISLVVQANEVIQLNDGKVYFQTVDQSGDFRVGSSFLVNQRTGNVSFGNAQINLSSLNQLTITDGTNNAIILPTSFHVGNLVLSGNSLVTQSGDLTLDPAGTLTTINSDVQINGVLNITTTSYINSSKILTAVDLVTVTHTATYITNDPGTVSGLTTIANTTTVYGTYDFGSVSDIWTFNDYNTGTNFGYYSIHDAATQPAFVVYIGFDGITDFNRIVLNINYTQASGHTQDIDLYNYVQNQWDTFTTYSGSVGWFEFILGTIDSAPYISGGKVTARIYHVSFGNTSHRTWIDYIALEKSIQGGQGPRGATGAQGIQGIQGLTTTTTSTFVFSNTLSSTATVTENAVYIAGGLGIGKSLMVTGEALFLNNVTFAGTSTYVYSTNTFYTDNLINIHTPRDYSTTTDHTWTVDDGKDIGHIFHYYKNSQDKDAFLGLANDSGYLEWYANGTEIGGIFTGTEYGIFKTGGIILTNTTASNSTSTGALTVAGGVGVGGNLYLGGALYQNGQQVLSTATINQYSNQTAIYAGTDTAVSANSGTQIYIWNTSTLQSITNRGNSTTNIISITNITSATSTNSGALKVVGGVGIGGNLYVGGDVSIGGSLVITTSSITGYVTPTVLTAGTDTAVSTSTGNITIWNTSTLQTVTGRGNSTTNAIVITNTTSSTSTNTGALQVMGGVGIGGNLYVGNRVGFVGTTRASVVYQFYNTLTNSLDTVFG